MAMGPARGKRTPIADINVTPMADVMIVLLVIFMLATPVLVRPPVSLPDAAHAIERKEQRVEVVVRASGEIAADGLVFAGPQSLTDWLSARRAGGLTQIVLVQADRGAAYGAVAPVLAACRQAGVEEIALAAEHRPKSR
jgi:biopolymer transport protein TolR